MTAKQYNRDNREIVWLTVSYSPMARGWFIETTYPGFITPKIARKFYKVEGTHTVYMVRGFDSQDDARAFAIDYYEAKRDGIISRIRLD